MEGVTDSLKGLASDEKTADELQRVHDVMGEASNIIFDIYNRNCKEAFGTQ